MDIEHNVQQATSDAENFLANGTFVIDPNAIVQRVVAPKASKRNFLKYFSKWRNAKILIAHGLELVCTRCKHIQPLERVMRTMLFKIAFSGLGLNSSKIVEAIGFDSPANGDIAFRIYINLETFLWSTLFSPSQVLSQAIMRPSSSSTDGGASRSS